MPQMLPPVALDRLRRQRRRAATHVILAEYPVRNPSSRQLYTERHEIKASGDCHEDEIRLLDTNEITTGRDPSMDGLDSLVRSWHVLADGDVDVLWCRGDSLHGLDSFWLAKVDRT